MDVITLSLLLLVPPLVYFYLWAVVSANFPMLCNKKVCLLIAHPDDEAMFFAPTLLALTSPESNNHVKILCLSAGDAEGLGEVRKKELVQSGLRLGLRRKEDVFIVDDKSRFPDSMKTTWSRDSISSLLSDAFICNQISPPPEHGYCTGAKVQSPETTIDVLITFDSSGVSGHINHCSLYHGACAWLSSLQQPGRISPVALYTLTSVGMARKYSSFFDIITTLAYFGLSTWGTDKVEVGNLGGMLVGSSTTPVPTRQRKPKIKKIPTMTKIPEEMLPSTENDSPRADHELQSSKGLVLISSLGPQGWGKAWRAMTQAHKSQMLWFRYGWILLSRYMVVNDLALVLPAEAAKAALAIDPVEEKSIDKEQERYDEKG